MKSEQRRELRKMGGRENKRRGQRLERNRTKKEEKEMKSEERREVKRTEEKNNKRRGLRKKRGRIGKRKKKKR